MSKTNLAIGADIGGTHITAALIDLQNKTVVHSSLKRAHVNAGGTADEIIAAWGDCIRDAQQNQKIESICLAMPGPMDYEVGISLMRGQAKYENLYEFNVKQLLATELNCDVASIFIENDAACFLQGEVFNGAANKYEDKKVLGITLGTGLGSAVYKSGLSKNCDMWCWPFKDKNAEDYISTRWFVGRWKEMTGETIEGVKAISQQGNEAMEQIFEEFAGNLAGFLYDFISNESPNAIVIGGNIAKAWERFGARVTAIVQEKYPTIHIEQAILGEEAPLTGAVSSWLQRNKRHSIHEYSSGS